jgi:CDP-diacylglycerol--serine O-phosphatidyltransferase
LSGLFQFENYALLSSISILTTSILMVSKIPTYSLKRILIPRHLAIFLLLGIGIYVSLLIFYTFETLFFSGLIYIFLIPISYFHYKHKNKTSLITSNEEETEDVL